MFTISKKIEIAGAHKLDLPYTSPCRRLHGHNWIIEVEISSENLNKSGMIIDFKELKSMMTCMIKNTLDHRHLNEVLSTRNPTAENIARWVTWKMQGCLDSLRPDMSRPCEELPRVSKVTVQESEGSKASFVP